MYIFCSPFLKKLLPKILGFSFATLLIWFKGVSPSGSFLTIFTSRSDHWFAFHNVISCIHLSDIGILLKRRKMETTMKNHPFCSSQLKEMVDQLEGWRVRNLSLYHEGASNTKDARDALMSLIRDDEKRQLMFCELRYESMVQSGIEHLQERRRREK
jgi:hypothetical protein